MKELTDSMLSQDMGEFNVVAIVFPLIILLLTLVICIHIYLTKKQEAKNNEDVSKKEFKGYGYKITIIVILIIVVIIFLNVDNIFKSGENSEWYLTYGTVIQKRERMTTSDPGTTETHYYIVVEDDDEVLVTKTVYDKLKEDDKVYVLRREDGSAEKIYLLDEYRYTGDRLRKN